MLLLPFRWNSCVFVVGLSLSFQVFFSVAALSSSFNKSFLLIASPSFSLELVRFRCGSFPVVPSPFFSLKRCPLLLISPSSIASPSFSFKLVRFRCGSFPVVPTLFFFSFSLWVFPCRSKSFFFVAALSSSFNKSFLLIASPSFLLALVRFRCGSFPVVPSLFFSVAALSSSFNKSFLLIASPSFSLELVRFRCGSFPVVPSLFFSLQRCPLLLISPSS